MLLAVAVVHPERGRERPFLLTSFSLLLSLMFLLLALGPTYPGKKMKWGRRKGPRYSIPWQEKCAERSSQIAASLAAGCWFGMWILHSLLKVPVVPQWSIWDTLMVSAYVFPVPALNKRFFFHSWHFSRKSTQKFCNKIKGILAVLCLRWLQVTLPKKHVPLSSLQADCENFRMKVWFKDNYSSEATSQLYISSKHSCYLWQAICNPSEHCICLNLWWHIKFRGFTPGL